MDITMIIMYYKFNNIPCDRNPQNDKKDYCIKITYSVFGLSLLSDNLYKALSKRI